MILIYSPHWLFFGNYTSKKINKQIRIHVFHMLQKQINITNIEIKSIKIELADELNYSGLTTHKHLKWETKAFKIVNIIGIMHRLKHMVPSEIL